MLDNLRAAASDTFDHLVVEEQVKDAATSIFIL